MKIERFHKNTTKLGLMFILLCLLALGLGPLPTSQAQAATAGFHVSGRYLLDAKGKNFIMRGINHAHTWWPTQTSSFRNIKTKRANTIRVVLSSGHRWTKNSASDVANVINLCKTNKLVCVLEVHDTTGYGEQDGAASLAQAVNYWKSIKSVLIGQEAYVIINIGNEPYGNIDTNGWVNATKKAITNLRNAGIHHTLMVDAPNWGQDWQFIMRDNAANIFDSDPDKNTIFSIHMYGVFDTEVEVRNYVTAFIDAGLPLVIGEFGWKHSDGDPIEDVIMAIAQEYGIGYLGWSWSGNSGGVEYLDMVINFNPNRMTWWGNRIINGENGICPTAILASVYGKDLSPRRCSITLFSVGAKDGWVLESTEISNKGGPKNSSATTLNLGDDASNRQYRAILHFDTLPLLLPDNAVTTGVKLKIKMSNIVGTNPFTTHGGLKVDIRRPYFGSTAALASNDFQIKADKMAIGTFGSTLFNGWYEATLNSAAFPYINLAGTTQIRLRFAKDDNNDHGADYARFFSGNAPSENRPVLVITYTVP
jgi:hypothetical protein